MKMIYLRVPSDLAAELVSLRYARRRSEPRGSVFEWLVDGSTAGSVLISLLQAPSVFEYYADWFRKRAAQSPDGKTSVSIDGPRGRLDLFDVHADEELWRLVKRLEPYIKE